MTAYEMLSSDGVQTCALPIYRVGGEADILETAIRHRIGGQSAGHGTCGRYAKIRLAIAFSYIIGRHANARISLRSKRSSISNAGRDDVTVMLIPHVMQIAYTQGQTVIGAGKHAGLGDSRPTAKFDRLVDLAQSAHSGIFDPAVQISSDEH